MEDYHGMGIRLTDDRLAHLGTHPEMAGLEPAIEKTLMQPEKVLECLREAAVKGAYRFYLGTRLGDRQLCAVVRVREDDALLVAAFVADLDIGGYQIWPRKDE
ncbi:MAG: hypothetical protein ACREI3_13170 [Nitrospirales bacterium]